MNLLEETREFLKDLGKTPKDILWCGNLNHVYISWKEFEKVASSVEYDNGFGGQEISSDLVIVGRDFWLERYEYDGAENWVYKSKPKKPSKAKTIQILSY